MDAIYVTGAGRASKPELDRSQPFRVPATGKLIHKSGVSRRKIYKDVLSPSSSATCHCTTCFDLEDTTIIEKLITG